ncbi:DNA circularization protein [Paraburkholderia aromaticivorans]|uniref:DNA circularization protein n=1 Tax=Paraburkholderia aromaticivorans TaxID=2026199 RepID=UPI001455FF7D|nr:DNA circularization N-terminal domain-containing protein [Paraburkholderia aromaticivorans]
MSVNSLVTFAGSVGGVASAASSLASILTGPGANTWWGSLRQASFGGVPFAVLDNRTKFGGRNVVHRYPYRDDVWVEPMGKLARSFDITGFLIENSLVYGGGSVIGQRDRLIAACETAGPQTLVHPTFGSVQNVSCLDSECSESIAHGRVIMVRLRFVRGGARIYPNVTTSTQSAVASAASGVTGGSLLDFARAAATVIQQGAAVVRTAVGTAISWYQTALAAIHDVKRVINAVSTLAGNFGALYGGGNSGYTGSNQTAPAGTTAAQLIEADTAHAAAVVAAGTALQTAAANVSDTATFAACAQQLVTAVLATAANPADAIRLASGMASFSPSDDFTSSVIGSSMSSMQTSCAALFRRCALAGVAQACSTYQPSSYDDATTRIENVTTLLDAEIENAGDVGDDESFAALRVLRNAVVTDLQSRGGDLAPLQTMRFNAPMPALVLAHRIYDDVTRVDQLVQQVQPIHPLFMPMTFQALAS